MHKNVSFENIHNAQKQAVGDLRQLVDFNYKLFAPSG